MLIVEQSCCGTKNAPISRSEDPRRVIMPRKARSRRASFLTVEAIPNTPNNSPNQDDNRKAWNEKLIRTRKLRLVVVLVLTIAAILITINPPNAGSFGSKACVNQIYSVNPGPLEACKDSLVCAGNIILEGWYRLSEWISDGLVSSTQAASLWVAKYKSSQTILFVRLGSWLAYAFAIAIESTPVIAWVTEYCCTGSRSYGLESLSIPVVAMIWDTLLLFSVAW